MVNFIEDNNILCDNQHDFRSGRSCLTQMLSHFDERNNILRETTFNIFYGTSQSNHIYIFINIKV